MYLGKSKIFTSKRGKKSKHTHTHKVRLNYCLLFHSVLAQMKMSWWKFSRQEPTKRFRKSAGSLKKVWADSQQSLVNIPDSDDTTAPTTAVTQNNAASFSSTTSLQNVFVFALECFSEYNINLEEVIRDETSGDFTTALLAMLKAEKDEKSEVDTNLARKDAEVQGK